MFSELSRQIILYMRAIISYTSRERKQSAEYNYTAIEKVKIVLGARATTS